jgi:hypothetical protein
MLLEGILYSKSFKSINSTLCVSSMRQCNFHL